MPKSTPPDPRDHRIADLESTVRDLRKQIKTMEELLATYRKLNQSDADSLFHSRRHNDFLMDSIAQLIFTSERQAAPQAAQEMIEEAVRQRMARVFEALQQDITDGHSDAETVRGLFSRVFPPIYSQQIAALHPAPGTLSAAEKTAYDIFAQANKTNNELILYYIHRIQEPATNQLLLDEVLIPLCRNKEMNTAALQRKQLKDAVVALRQGKPDSAPSTIDKLIGRARLAVQCEQS